MENGRMLVDRYVAVWNEPDRHRRREEVAALWCDGGAHLAPTRRAFGHGEIEAQVQGTFERFVAARNWRFRVADGTQQASNVVRLHWQAVSNGKGAIEASGIEFLVLGEDGRIQFDYHMVA